METKVSRIAAFIESLPIDNNIGDCESALLSTNMTFMGGNGGDCENDWADRCENATNEGDCKNYNRACSKAVNKGTCLNTTVKRQICPNMSC